MKYNTSVIREFLITAFDDSKLTALCYDYFREVYDRFSIGQEKPVKIQILIEHCERNNLMDELLIHVKPK